jgi:hypothetical protein
MKGRLNLSSNRPTFRRERRLAMSNDKKRLGMKKALVFAAFVGLVGIATASTATAGVTAAAQQCDLPPLVCELLGLK